MAILLTLILLLSIVGSALAQEDRVSLNGNMPAISSRGQGPTDPAELEAFLGDLFAQDMEEHHIAGAAVAVVKDGKLFFAKGYGYADVENRIPVDPEETVFLIGSAGKLFTWTAVMQLAEQGKLDMDADINTYLDFRIPDTYPEPITLNHLLTHTAGFEERWFETFTLDADELLPVGEWLASHIPARVRPPGECAAYSNYGTELAGYIVERVSGQPYDHYIQEHIFSPLGMERSAAHLPIPPDMGAYEAIGYLDDYQPVPHIPDDYMGQLAMVPAGAHASSAMDMARFMIAHLQDGHYSDENIPGARILEDSTARQMHTTLYTPDPRLLGTAYGFFDFSDNGQRTLGHSGSTLGFNTLLLLLPDQNLGVFVSYNAENVGDLTTQHFGFQRAFFDHYYPTAAVESLQPSANFAERAGRFLGTYQPAQKNFTTLEKFQNLMNGGIVVSDPGNGALLLTTPYGNWQFVEVQPLYFRQEGGQFAILFREDGRGRITHMFLDAAPQYAFEKLKWYEMPGFNLPLILGCVLIFLSMLPVAVMRFVRNRRRSDERTPTSSGARAAGWIILAICVLNLLFVAGSMVWGEAALKDLRFGASLIYNIVLGMGILSAALTVGALVYVVLAWKDGYWSIAFRAYYTLVTVAAIAFVWFLNFWNLLGWQY
jgi:CubicO group peptidase (beta-lactamase class C family)